MSLSLSEAITYFTLVISTFYQVNGQNISIIRGKHDVFTNLARCNLTKAVCFDTNCTYCQCERTNETFIRTRGRHGQCVQNDYLAYVTSSHLSFLVQETTKKSCLFHYKPNRYRYVQTTLTCDNNAISQRWLWTKNGQLLNLDVLQCISVGWKRKNYNYYYLLLKKCDSNNKNQLWKCSRNDPYYVWQEESKGYLHYGDYGRYVLSHSEREKALKWKRYGSNKTLCSEPVGCETFQDGSSLLILNQTARKCQPKSECSGEKEIDVGKNVTKCFLSSNQIQYLHKDGWKPLIVEKEPFTVVTSKNKTLLKWNLVKTPECWKGLIVKVQFQCEDQNGSGEDQNNNEEVHCVLIKYTGLFTGFDKSGRNDKYGEEDRSQTTVIIVCVLVITFVIGVVVFFGYRNKNRLVTLLGRNKENPDITRHASPGQRSGVSNNPIYRSSDKQSAQNNCELYETTDSEPVYQYANAGHEPEAQLQSNFTTYDYALPDDHSRIGQRICVGEGEIKEFQSVSELNNTNKLSPVYQVLEKSN